VVWPRRNGQKVKQR